MIENHKSENPYRPLRSLEKQDCGILVGRENDIDNFMSALLSPKTRVLILNGESGVGKSSFLQALFIPKIEQSNSPFKRFDLINFNEEKIISYGVDPIYSVANAIFHSEWKKQVLKISEKVNKNKRKLTFMAFLEKIKQAKKGYKPEEEKWKEINEIFRYSNVEKFKEFLKRRDGFSDFFRLFSFYSPYTKILIFDHTEQLFNSSDIKNTEEFLEGIRYFSKHDCDVKIILSIRADYLAQLRDKIYSPLFPENIRDIYLKDIEDEKYLLDAIKKPCIKSGFSFSDERIPLDIVTKIKKKKIKNVSVLPVLHIICYKIYEDMMERRSKYAIKEKIIDSNDIHKYHLNDDGYVQVISLFVQERVKKICDREDIFKNKETREEKVYDLLFLLIEKDSHRRKILEKEHFESEIQNLNFFEEKKIKEIISILDDARIIVLEHTITLSHDLFAEAVVRLKAGLLNVFENKRDPGIENAMISIISEFKNKFNKKQSEKLRIASIIGKQFFHKNGSFYNEINELLDEIKFHFDSNATCQSNIKVLMAKPFSKLFLYRAESEIGLSFDCYFPSSVHNDVWEWKNDRIFKDSLITISRLLFLEENYINIIEVRLTDFMPISMLAYDSQSVFNPYTFAAHVKRNENEEWCGTLPTYHHIKQSYQYELKNHFEYLWSKGITLDQFIDFLSKSTGCKEYKMKFLNLLLEERKKQEENHELI